MKTDKSIAATESGESKELAEEPKPIKVLWVDDHEVILDGIISMMRRHWTRLKIQATAMTMQEALNALSKEDFDAVITDVRLKSESGIDLAREVAVRYPNVPVMLFTVYDDEQYLFQALRVGVRGFVLKQASSDDLVGYIEQMVSGEIIIDPSVAGRVALFAARLHSGEFWPGAHLGMTQRESEVLELVVKGLSNKAIASQLIVGEETVKTHLSAIYRKLNVRDRSQAVAVAIREGVFK